MKYQVIFKGKLNEDLSQTAILNNLMQLFQASEADINSRFFSGKESVIAENLSEEEADNYVALIRNAGAGVIKILQIEVNSTLPEYTPQYHKHDSLYGFQVNDTHQSDINNLYTVSETGERYIPSEVRPPKEKTFLRNDSDMNAKDIIDEIYGNESKKEVPLLSKERIGRIRFILRLFVSSSIPVLCYWLFYLFTYLKVSYPDSFARSGIDAFINDNYNAIGFSLLALLFIYFCCFSMFYVQRLHDFNRSAWWFVFIIFAINPLAYGLNQIATVQAVIHPLYTDKWQEIFNNLLLFKNTLGAASDINTINGSQVLSVSDPTWLDSLQQTFTQLNIEMNFDAINLFSLIILILLINAFIHLLLFLIPGSKTYNDFGIRPSQIRPKRYITLVASLILIISPMLFGEIAIEYLNQKMENTAMQNNSSGTTKTLNKDQKAIFVK